MSQLLLKISYSLGLCLGIMGMVGCGGGGGADEDVNPRPLSLHGITMKFNGAWLTFSTGSPNSSPTGTETGGITYERRSEDTMNFAPTDPTVLDALQLSWPLDLGGGTYYEYSPIDANTGKLLIYPENSEGGTILNHFPSSGQYDIFTIRFDEANGVLPTASVTITITDYPPPAGFRYINEEQATLQLGTLTDNAREVPAGWDGVNKGPGFITYDSFVGKTLTLTRDDATSTEISFGNFLATGPVSKESNKTVETGTTNGNIDPKDFTGVKAFEAGYVLEQPFGTETVKLIVNYTSSAPLPTPGDETITLTFLGGQKLSAGDTTIDVRTGTYVSTNGTSGDFILEIE